MVPVHWQGLPCDMDQLAAFAKEKGLVLCEDCAMLTGGHHTFKYVREREDLEWYRVLPLPAEHECGVCHEFKPDVPLYNWAPWLPHVEDSANAFKIIRAVTALRRGPAKDFLVYGRMLRPARVNGILMIEWKSNGRNHRIPAVFHSAWQAPDGRAVQVRPKIFSGPGSL